MWRRRADVASQKTQALLFVMINLILVTSIFILTYTFASDEKSSYFIELFMTNEDRIKSGYEKLSDEEKEQLNLWFIRTIMKILSMKDKYNNVGKTVTIDEKCNGRVLILSDGSVWSINMIETYKIILWMPFDRLIVIESKNSLYPYKIINLSKDEEVLAKYIGSEY